MKKKTIIWMAVALIFVAITSFAITLNSVSSFETLKNFDKEIKIYKSQSCGCCGIYSSYFRNKGNAKAQIIDLQELDKLKQQYDIPLEMQSCHTTIIGDYFIEGHIPLEAIEKLLKEKPNIRGIAMPGMPSGSPGMPGSKMKDFIIYKVNYDGSYDEFMKI